MFIQTDPPVPAACNDLQAVEPRGVPGEQLFLDPVGVVRDASDDGFIPVPGEQRHLDWEAGMRLFNLSLEERTRLAEQRLARAGGHPSPRP